MLVTGGAGFIGSHVVDTLLDAGYDVSVVDDLHTGKRENVNPAARFHQVDIRDAAALDAVFAAERPAGVVHEAAWADVRGSLADPQGYSTVNVIGTLNLLEAARRHGARKDRLCLDRRRHLRRPGRAAGDRGLPARPARPVRREQAVVRVLHVHLPPQLRAGLLRPALRQRLRPAAGPAGRGRGGGHLHRQDAEGRAGGHQRRRPPEPRLRLRGRRGAGQPAGACEAGSGIYNVGTGVPTDVNTIFRELARLTGYTARSSTGRPSWARCSTRTWMPGTAERELGWTAEVPLAEGLARTVEYFRDQYDG